MSTIENDVATGNLTTKAIQERFKPIIQKAATQIALVDGALLYMSSPVPVNKVIQENQLIALVNPLYTRLDTIEKWIADNELQKARSALLVLLAQLRSALRLLKDRSCYPGY